MICQNTPALSRAVMAAVVGLSLLTPMALHAGEGAGGMFEQGLTAEDAGRLDDAARHYRALVEQHADSALAPRALLALVKVLAGSGDVAAAVEAAERRRGRFASAPGFDDELDALLLHVKSMKPGMYKKKGNQPADGSKLSDIEKKLSAAVEAAKLSGDAGALKRAQKALRKHQKKGSGAKGKAPKAGEEQLDAEIAKLQAEQERLIEEAHGLEDAGRVEEAFASRQKADALALKVEEARRSAAGAKKNRKKKKNKGKGKGKKARKNRRLMERRRVALQQQVKKLDAKIAAARSKDDAAVLAELESLRGKLLEQRKQLERQLRASEGRSKPADSEGSLRSELGRARFELDRARAASDRPLDGEMSGPGGAQLADLESRLAGARKSWQDHSRKQASQRLKQLSRTLQRQGLGKAEVAERLDFAKKELELREREVEEQERLRYQLEAEGAGKSEADARLRDAEKARIDKSRKRQRLFNQSVERRRRERQDGADRAVLEERLAVIKGRLEAEGKSEPEVLAELEEARQGIAKGLAEARRTTSRKERRKRDAERARVSEAKLVAAWEKKGLSKEAIAERLKARKQRERESKRQAAKKKAQAKKGSSSQDLERLKGKVRQQSEEIERLKAVIRELQRRAVKKPARQPV